MQPFKHLARARSWPATTAEKRHRQYLASLLAVVAVSFAAVLAGSALLPASTAGRSVRPVPAERRPRAPAAPRAREPGGGATSSPGLGPGPASRVAEILRVREQAYARRDAALLDTIYTADCACLRSGRAAIARLLADHAVWRGRSVSVRVERLSRVNDSIWIALAVLRRGAFRIEREDGALISAEPAVRQRYSFVLVRAGTGPWLLGHASLVGELAA